MSERTPHIKPHLGDTGSFAREYFDQIYDASLDPWELATSEYEASKYKATLAALPARCYQHALELGCSIGILTRLLAERCERLRAIDISTAALKQALHRCADTPHVVFEAHDLAESFPAGRFDLIVVSEVGYYLSMLDLWQLRAAISSALLPQGHLVLVHYCGETNYPLSAQEVHTTFRVWGDAAWKKCVSIETQNYLLDVFEASNVSKLR